MYAEKLRGFVMGGFSLPWLLNTPSAPSAKPDRNAGPGRRVDSCGHISSPHDEFHLMESFWQVGQDQAMPHTSSTEMSSALIVDHSPEPPTTHGRSSNKRMSSAI